MVSLSLSASELNLPSLNETATDVSSSLTDSNKSFHLPDTRPGEESTVATDGGTSHPSNSGTENIVPSTVLSKKAIDFKRRGQLRALAQRVPCKWPSRNPSAVFNLGRSIAIPRANMTGKIGR